MAQSKYYRGKYISFFKNICDSFHAALHTGSNNVVLYIHGRAFLIYWSTLTAVCKPQAVQSRHSSSSYKTLFTWPTEHLVFSLTYPDKLTSRKQLKDNFEFVESNCQCWSKNAGQCLRYAPVNDLNCLSSEEWCDHIQWRTLQTLFNL